MSNTSNPVATWLSPPLRYAKAGSSLLDSQALRYVDEVMSYTVHIESVSVQACLSLARSILQTSGHAIRTVFCLERKRFAALCALRGVPLRFQAGLPHSELQCASRQPESHCDRFTSQQAHL
jgi:hypothetical protein